MHLKKSCGIFLILGTVLAVSTLAQEAPPAAPARPEPKPLPDVVARVNGRDVLKEELIDQLRIMRSEAMRVSGQDLVQDPQFLAAALSSLIDEILLVEDSLQRGAGATPAEIDQAIAKMRAGFADDAAFEQALARQGGDREALRRQLRESISVDKVISTEIAPALRQVTDAEKRGFYDSNQERMRVPERFRVRHLVVAVAPDAADEAVATARSKAEGLLARIRGGADFATLAKEQSDDESSRDRGGELPVFPLLRPDLPFEQAVGKLEVGKISDVVRTEMGFHVIELLERLPSTVRPYESVEGEIEGFLKKVLIREEIQRRVAKLRETAEIQILI